MVTKILEEMGKERDLDLSYFPSPCSSSSSSDFEFALSLSPASRRSPANLCPADELFYMGQLLPLHPSPRISMVRTLLLASASTSSSSATATSRDSNGSTSSSFSTDLLLPDCDSSRPSSVTEDDASRVPPPKRSALSSFAARFSSVFLHRGGSKRDHHDSPVQVATPSTIKSNTSAKDVIKKYMKKMKPLYEMLSYRQPQQQQQQMKTFSFSIRRDASLGKRTNGGCGGGGGSQSFSGNLRYPRRKMCARSCPSSMRSSPSHSGLLCVGSGLPKPVISPSSSLSSSSSMEELQSAIQGAIAHCKSTMIEAKEKKAQAS